MNTLKKVKRIIKKQTSKQTLQASWKVINTSTGNWGATTKAVAA